MRSVLYFVAALAIFLRYVLPFIAAGFFVYMEHTSGP